MPEHAGIRDKYESRIRSIIKNTDESQRKKIRRAMGNPPDLKNVPESLWDEIEQEQKEVMASLLAFLLMDVYSETEQIFGMTYSRYTRLSQIADSIPQAATSIAETNATQFSTRRVASIRRALEKASVTSSIVTPQNVTRRIIRGVSEEPLIKTLASRMGPKSAENISISETTSGISAGEKIYVDIARELITKPPIGVGGIVTPRSGIVPTITEIWITEKDGFVCPICRPLHKKPREFWDDKFPGGPRAHPRCRCWLIYRVMNAPPGFKNGIFQ